jgi:serine/threonine protein phosphatase PrpC
VALFVEKKFVSTLTNLKSYKKKNYEKALYETFLAMDEQIVSKEGIEILKKLKEDEQAESMAGCTANVLLLTDKEMFIANAGDSRSVLRTKQV